jgi:rubrerythrin
MTAVSISSPSAAGTFATAPELSDKTRENLMKSMQGEAFAFVKYSLYAEQARKDGLTEVAAAFETAASAERLEHFAEFAQIYGLVGNTKDNLREAIRGEMEESTSIYPGFAADARAEDAGAVADRFSEVASDEQDHAAAFSALLRTLE